MGFRNWPARLFVVEWLRIRRSQPLVEPAGDLVLGRGVFGVDWFEGRFAFGALGVGDGVAGLERAAFGWIIVRGDVAGKREVFLFASGIGLRNGFREPWLQLVRAGKIFVFVELVVDARGYRIGVLRSQLDGIHGDRGSIFRKSEDG